MRILVFRFKNLINKNAKCSKLIIKPELQIIQTLHLDPDIMFILICTTHIPMVYEFSCVSACVEYKYCFSTFL